MRPDFVLTVHMLSYMDEVKRGVTSEEISVHIDATTAVVNKILRNLQKADLVQKEEGKEDSYLLLYRMDEILLSDLANVIYRDAIPESFEDDDSSYDAELEKTLLELDAICRRFFENKNVKDIAPYLLETFEKSSSNHAINSLFS